MTAPLPPRVRGAGRRVADRALGRLLRLPPPTTGYTVTRDVRIPMRDGEVLLADHWAPDGPALGTLLLLSPYGWSGPMAALHGGTFAARGYHVVLARCRGTFGSGGDFRPMVHEVEDGADTVAWLRGQPWFGGRFATLGMSYLGFTQWALLVDPPPELATAIVQVGPHDFGESVYAGGAFALTDFLGWSDMVASQEEARGVRGLARSATATRRLAPALAGLPLADAGEALLAGWYRDWVSRRDLDDPFWAPMRLGAALDRVEVPVLLHTGWQDLFLEQSLAQYAHLRARGLDVALTVGPWTHLQVLTRGAGPLLRECLDWLGEHLAGTAVRTRPAPVRVHVTGAGEWRDLPGWPPATGERVLYLAPGGALAPIAPPATAGPARFPHDPADPTPTVGGRLLGAGSGYRDDRRLATRDDVLVLDSAPLPAPLEIAGCPVVELAHSSDNPHVDLFARVSEVDARGRSRNVSDGFRRLDPAGREGAVRLELDAVAHRFRAGSRVRLLVAGGSHPRFERNLGTGEDPATSARTAPSLRSITLAGGASRLLLPVLTAGTPDPPPQPSPRTETA
ncbi:CocE/NonD family hydrolase [Geodermatophilus sp. SYSU D00758]